MLKQLTDTSKPTKSSVSKFLKIQKKKQKIEINSELLI